MAAVAAAQRGVAVQHECDVAVRAADRRATGAAVERGCDPAPVQEEDRLAAPVDDPPELVEERCRERVAGLAPEIDDADGRQVGAEPAAELEALERRPALGTR